MSTLSNDVHMWLCVPTACLMSVDKESKEENGYSVLMVSTSKQLIVTTYYIHCITA